MSKLLFRFADGHVTPVLPVTATGEALVADGERILDVDQAESRTNLSQRELRKMYEAVWPDAVPDHDVFGQPAGPVGSFITSPRATLSEFDQLALEHELRYPHLRTNEFELFDTMRQKLGVARFCRAVHPYVVLVDGRRTIELHTSIHELRRIAMAHPEYDGEDAPEFCGADDGWTQVWNADRPPVAARSRVYRRRNGVRLTFERVARWKAYAPVMVGDNGVSDLPPHWIKNDAEMLGKCSSALANRAGFGSELKGLYTHDEMEQAKAGQAERRPSPSRPAATLPAESQLRYQADAAVDDSQLEVFDLVDDPPADETEFNARLAKLIPDRHVRASTLDAYLRRWRPQYRANRGAFWAAVLVAVGRQTAAAS